MRAWTWEQACRRRLRRHGLLKGFASLPDAAHAVVGMHAQVMSAAEVALGLRTVGVTRTDVRDALWTRRELVKTYGPRGTVHLVSAEDLPGWCAGLAEAPWSTRGRPPAMRMSDQQNDQVVDAVDAALWEGDLTVEELDAEVVRRTGPWAGELVVPGFEGWWPRWRQAIPLAAYRGVLCFGRERSRRTVYTHPKRWLPGFSGPPATAGLAQLVVEYLDGYGPATAKNVAQWLGVADSALRDVVGSLGEAVEEVALDGVPALLPAPDAAPDAAPEERDTVHLLPYFDPYVVGCHPRSRLFPGEAERALSRGQAGTRAVVLVGGSVAGIWHQRRSGRTLHLTVELFAELAPAQLRRLESEVDRIAALVEARPALTFGAVTAGHHL